MLSPAAQHRVQTSNSISEPGRNHHRQAYQSAQNITIEIQFKTDKASLKAFKSLSRKAEIKRGLLPRYEAWIDGLMNAGTCSSKQESMFVWLLLWHIDCGRWSAALKMAVFALECGMNAPDDFKRNLAETLTEGFADGLSKGIRQGNYISLLDALAVAVANHDMSDLIAAKLYKLRGMAYLDSEPEQSYQLLTRALKLNEHSGVKRHLQRLKASMGAVVVPVGVDTESADISLNDYTLSARAAARWLGMTAPTFMRLVKRQPEQFPHVLIPSGKRNLYRFNPDDIEAFKKSHLVT